jgi:hypothetical protein
MKTKPAMNTIKKNIYLPIYQKKQFNEYKNLSDEKKINLEDIHKRNEKLQELIIF